MISAMMEDSNSTRATKARKRTRTSTLERPSMRWVKNPGTGQNTRQMKIQNKSGVLRNSSMYAVAIHLNTRLGPEQ